MAPEQFEGLKAAPAIDIYALGVILYELLTGRVPFQGAKFADTMVLALNQEPVPPRRLQPGVPRDLEVICLSPYFPDDLRLSARHVRRNPGIPSDSASFLPK